MIKKRRNIKKEKLKEKLLNEQQGFIVGNALIILPLIFSLIIIAVGLYNHNNNPLPQFTDKHIEFICVEEGLE